MSRHVAALIVSNPSIPREQHIKDTSLLYGWGKRMRLSNYRQKTSFPFVIALGFHYICR